ncbi:U3 small nucleolar RNA-associated protein 4 homolog isoform X1 [Dermochelys coriacea]|uniref:U3 small nucleolar RNA-associated protein 4 homolog isoform X1 n=1 Tax=Dermochelys coriacea TaxID=27794 RepID=UPI0018E8EB8E|nr:U3 small nucleolar RNA-associated protein 4 homolog isoform X1 [Dermochelys coriacea]
MGEFQVHRVRFFAYVPAGIRCVALSARSGRLALARTNGALEVYNFAANYFQEKGIPGHETRSTEALCWAAGDRLFGAGLGGDISEYDLEKLRVKYSLDGFGGPIWSMAADPSGTELAVGCEDGSVKLFQVLPDKIQFEKSLDRQKGRVMSLSWHPSGTRIAVGSIDLLRVFDVKSGHAIQRILVDRHLQGLYSRECVVWSVAFLSDGTIVSSDSVGKVQFWDSEKGTLLETHPVSSSAVLCLAVSEEEDSIVVGTSEGAVYQFQLLPVKWGSAESKWVRTKPFQHHTHDVRAVAHSATALISGGLDAQLVIRPLMEKMHGKGYDAALRKFTFPHRRLVSCAKKAGLLLFQFPQHLELWRLGATNSAGKDGDILPVSRAPEHLLQLKSKGPEHICCSCISLCGSWIAYSTASRLHLHRVHWENGNVSVKRVSKVPKLLSSAHQLLCSADSTNLFVASDQGAIHVLKLLEPGSCGHLQTLRPNSGSAEAVYLLAASVDGEWLAAAGGDWEINIYSLRQFKPHCTVPAYNCAVTALAIHPVTNNLVITHSDQQVFEFSIPDREYTTWSRKVQQHGLHKGWLERDTPITHITFNPKQPAHILLHDTHMFCILDKSLPLPDDATPLMNQTTLKQLSEKARRGHAHAFKICKKYQPLLFVDLLEEGSLVVVERPLMDIKTQLPPPVQQKKFGT